MPTFGISTNKNLSSNVDCLKQNGINFVFRYYSHVDSSKTLTEAEAIVLSKASVTIGVVFEDNPVEARYFSNIRGHKDAVNAYSEALQIHQPPGSAIYFAVDYDASKADISVPIFSYFAGLNKGLSDASAGHNSYDIGVYGSGAVCDFLKAHCPYVKYTWLAESTGWSGSQSYSAWNVKQKIAQSSICNLVVDKKNSENNAFEENEANGNFGGFTIQ